MWFIAAVIYLLEVLLSSRDQIGFPGPDRYFASQWTLSYGDTLSRRGLLGEILRVLHLDNGNYALIETLSWLISIAVFAFLVSALIRFLEPLPKTPRALLFIALLMSPLTTGILVQAVGDPIQLVFLLYLSLTLYLLKPRHNIYLAAIVFALFGAASILVHEATLFFIGPLLLLSAFFLRRSALDRAALFGYIVGAVPVLALIIHATEHNIAPMVTPLHLGGAPIVTSDVLRLSSFSTLMTQENADHFHNGLRGDVLTLRNFIGALILPLFFAAALSYILPVFAASRKKGIFIFMLPVLLSSPLWIIGHDWGRFTSYLFILTLAAISTVPMSLASATTQQNSDRLYLTMILLAVLAGITTTRALPNYIVKGVGCDNVTMIAVLIICAVGFISLRKHREMPAASRSFTSARLS